jgi:hypothetical protein
LPREKKLKWIPPNVTTNSVSDTQALGLPELMGLKQAGVHDRSFGIGSEMAFFLSSQCLSHKLTLQLVSGTQAKDFSNSWDSSGSRVQSIPSSSSFFSLLVS